MRTNLLRMKLFLLLGASVGTPAFAQNATPAPAANPDQGGIADIVVTATKRGAEALSKVPMSITAVTGAEAAKFGITNVIDLNVRTTGLVFTANTGTAQPFIRGIGSDFSSPGLEPPVSIYLDDVYWQRSQGSIYDLVDVNEVQVLKGPQGTLYGRNATGGAILINTNNPTSRFEGHVLGEYGNLNHKKFEGVLNTPLAPNLNFRIAASYGDRDGYVHNPTNGEDWGGYRNYEFRGKLEYSAGITDALLTVGYQNSSSYTLRQELVGAPLCAECALVNVPPPAGSYETYEGARKPVTDKTIYGTLRVTVTGDKLNLTSITAARHQKYFGDSDESGMAEAPGATELQDYENPVKGTDLMQEFRLNSTFSGPINFLLGVTGQHTKESTGANILPGDLQVTDHAVTNSIAAYAELYWNITDALKLTAGGRYNYDHRHYHVVRGPVATAIFGPPAPGDTGSGHWGNFTPRVVLQYQPDARQNYYASYNKGFKSGGFNFPAFTTPAVLKPETIESYEVGAKNRFMDNRIATTVAVFYYNYKNIQVSRVDALGSVKQNAASARGYGAEADIQVMPLTGLTFGAGYSYLHAQYRDFPDAAVYLPTAEGFVQSPTGANADGDPLARAPRSSGYLSVSYDHSITDYWDGAVSVIGRYTSSFEFNPLAGGPANLDRQKGYELVNLTGSVGPKDGRYRFGFFINNLTSRKYYLFVNTGGLGTYGGIAPPRTYGGNLRVNF